MIANYYTIRHIALQLNHMLKGWAVKAIFSQNRNELILDFGSSFGTAQHPQSAFLLVSCEPAKNHLFLEGSFARAKRNSLDFFPQTIGQSVTSVAIHPADRQVTFSLESGLSIVAQLFGSRANVLLVREDDTILESFLRSKEVEGQKLTQRHELPSLSNKETFLREIRDLGEISLGVALKKFFPLFGTTLLTELVFRAGLVRSESIDRLSEEELERIFATGDTMRGELVSAARPRVYFEEGKAVEFSIIDLHHRKQNEVREFDSLDDAIRTYLIAASKDDRVAREKGKIVHGITKEIDRLSRTLAKMMEEAGSAHRADRYEMMGELLKAHLHELQKGSAEAILENTLDGSNELVEIPLDKNLTPAKNADRYFEKAKKSRTATLEKKEHSAKLQQQQAQLNALLKQLDPIALSQELDTFLEQHRTLLAPLGLAKPGTSRKAREEEVPFRVFRVEGDFVVWAGKSGENNDLLSTRYTKSQDLWFHARAVGGSHVVLKAGSGKGEVSKKAIQEAAAIAAYYSKMKTSKLVPVSMCEGKYVRKPKGAPAGTVTIEREKVLFVEPRLPMSH
jgi:predicted ribosome quality control (RQC) complex YloA/Tae2 family protein